MQKFKTAQEMSFLSGKGGMCRMTMKDQLVASYFPDYVQYPTEISVRLKQVLGKVFHISFLVELSHLVY